VEGAWRRLRSEELHNLCASQNIINAIRSKRMRWAGHVWYAWDMRNAYLILVGKPEGK